MEVDYVTTKEACRITGFKAPTLRGWSNVGKVKTTRTLANQRLYDRQSLLSFIGGVNDGIEKEKIIYCRVSSKKQSEHFEHQIEFCKQYYPDHTVITDISSGINFNRKGIQTVLESAMRGYLEELVVAYKDTLCRFGYELIEWIVGRYGGRIVVLDEKTFESEETELANDLLSIIHVFSCKQLGKRRYKKSKSKNLSNTSST